MDGPTIKTLAIIAYKAPVLQAEIIKIRGNKAYEHIKQLKDQALIISEPKGRSNLIKLTPQFYDYFDTAEPEIKEQFGKFTERMEKGKVKYDSSLEDTEYVKRVKEIEGDL